MTSEPSSAWTLVLSKLSASMANFNEPALNTDKPVNESNPNWNNYRLPLEKMEALRSASTHWRITCSFPVSGVDYRDYARAKFSDVDMISFKGVGSCKKTEYIDIRGHNCTNCMIPWWQGWVGDNGFFHTDSSVHCTGRSHFPGSLGSEDNFGHYAIMNKNFRCTKDSESTTNYWIGGYF